MLTAMLPASSERRPKVYSARALAALCLWAAACSLLSFSFSEAEQSDLAFLLGTVFFGLSLVTALVFVPLFAGLVLRPLPLAKPDPSPGGKGAALVVESSGDPMREALGWLPRLAFHETAAVSGLLSFAVLAAWGAVDRAAPDAVALKRLLLAAGAFLPPLLVGWERLGRRDPNP